MILKNCEKISQAKVFSLLFFIEIIARDMGYVDIETRTVSGISSGEGSQED